MNHPHETLGDAIHDALDDRLDDALPPKERRWLKWLKRAGWTIAGLYFLAALAVVVLRFAVMPAVGDYKDDIAAAASRAIGARVTVEEIAAEWYGLHPRFHLKGVRVFDPRGEEALELPEVDATVAWRSALVGELRFRSLVFERPDVRIRRDPDGRLFVAGLEIERNAGTGGDGGGADWLLRHAEILIRDATVEWEDGQRNAPPLRLERLGFLLRNDGRAHRFALRADPPGRYSAPLDVRGVLEGETVERFAEWDGRLYVAADFVDLAAWQAWIDYPFEVRDGRGALRLWVSFADLRLTELAADVALNDAVVRFAKDAPLLEATRVTGRFGFRERAVGTLRVFDRTRRIAYDAFAQHLELATKDGVDVAPADFTAHWEPAQGRDPEKGEFSSRMIDIAPVAALGERLPLPKRLREALARMAPRGRLADARFAWTGPLDEPQTFSAHARFTEIGISAYGTFPGVTGLTGTFDATEAGGALQLASAKTAIDAPELLREGAVAFDSLSGRVTWSRPERALELRFDGVSVANADFTLAASGVYRTARPDGTGAMMDITGRIDRLDGRTAYKYIPRLGADTTRWLKRGVLAAAVTDGRIRVRGDPADFPFRDAKRGEFRIAGKIGAAHIFFGDGWPEVRNVQADIVFDGPRMIVTAPRGTSMGLQLSAVTATVPDLFAERHEMIINGQIDGALGDFLRYIAESPVRRFLDGLTDPWKGSGRGSVQVRIDMPLDNVDATKVAGAVQFQNATIDMGPGDPTITQINGRLNFTDTSASSNGLTGQALGGDVTVLIATRDRAITTSVQGTVDGTQLMRFVGLPLAERVRGPLPFRYATTGRKGAATSSFESTLAGVALELPPPLGKGAGETLPLRVDWKQGAGGPRTESVRRDALSVALGKVASAQGVLRIEGDRTSIERAGVGIGDIGVPVPERPGIFVAGNLPKFDLDAVLAMFPSGGAHDANSLPSITALNFRAGTLQAAGRQFNDVTIRAQFGADAWQATVNAREAAGELSWRPEGKGLVVARLKHLVLPEHAPGSGLDSRAAKQLPALSIVADSFTFKGRDLGRLEVEAVNEAGGWRLEKLGLAAAEGRLSARGLWRTQTSGEPPRTDLDVKIEVTDVGKYLARFGYADAIAGGTATLDGRFGWAGPVYEIDYPSLGGELKLQAAKGQFLKVQPGIGKLLGVLSLQSLPRRITLDFRDIFSEGFAFDEIAGTAAIRNGVASTQDLAMTGPAATVAITGTADIAREQQDLNVKVVPVVGDSVAAAAALALLNPLVGVGALLAQRLFRDPLGQMLAFEYRVTGSFEDPKVERVRAPQVAAEPGAAHEEKK